MTITAYIREKVNERPGGTIPAPGRPASRSSRSTPPPRRAAADNARTPGRIPFTRGIHPLMYRKQPWTMRQYTGTGNAADTNAALQVPDRQRPDGAERRLRPADQIGWTPDDPLAEGEVGRVGMAIDTLRDFEIAFDGIRPRPDHRLADDQRRGLCLIAMYLAMADGAATTSGSCAARRRTTS